MLIKKLKSKLKNVLSPINYDLGRYYDASIGTCINIGSGRWHHPKWTNLDLVSDWYHQDKTTSFIPFDITKDNLPFQNSTIDLAYCSHVIEHLEDERIKHFFSEVIRVLKPGGGFRVTCPDSKFLFEISKQPGSFWAQRHYWALGPQSSCQDLTQWTNLDFLVREIATPKCRHYLNKTHDVSNDSLGKLDYESLMNELTRNLKFNPKFPGNHINWWDIDKIRRFFSDFDTKVIHSRMEASIFKPMQDIRFFDSTAPWMSVYVDIIKLS
jgi:SAM-dependent methyltransferase